MIRAARLIRPFVSAVAVAIVFAPPAAAYTITLNNGGSSMVSGFVSTCCTEAAGEVDSPTAFSGPNTVEASVSFYLSRVTYTLSNSGFDFAMRQTHNGALFSASGARSSIFFSVDEDVYYSASGSYGKASTRSVAFGGSLLDLTSGPFNYVFDSYQRNAGTYPNFTLGGAEGNEANRSRGSLDGMLRAGRSYEFRFEADLRTGPYEDPDQVSGYGSGNISLAFTAVPEPNTALLLGLGLVALSRTHRKSGVAVVNRQAPDSSVY